MSRKIAIITITNGQNYGNRLQNFALQEFLKEFDLEVSTINNVIGKFDQRKKLDRVVWLLRESIKQLLGRRKGLLNEYSRVIKFNSFDKRYVNFFKKSIRKGVIPQGMVDEFDWFVCGSDQIWNPMFDCNSSIDFLTFVPLKKRLSYAASFGVDSIPEEKQEIYRKWLLGMPNLSVREPQGEIIINQICGRNSHVNVDPTLLISRSQWEKLEHKPISFKNEKYIVIYILGGMTDKIANIVEQNEFSKYKKIYISESAKKIKEVYGPTEFLWLIHHAECIFTNSFHGVVFSIIFEKKFFPLMNYSNNRFMNSRFELLERIVESDICDKKEVIDIRDNEKIPKNIAEERFKSMEYIKSIMEKKENEY